MSARNILMAAAGFADDKLYVDDVFSAYTYTGNGTTQTINNGIDLAGKGGMVWIKGRSAAYSHSLYDTARGAPNRLSSETSGAQISGAASLTSFSSNGFALGNISNVNQTLQTFVSWTFRKAPKFFDVVTYTGNGSARTIAHSLGVEPGLIIIKGATSLANWQVWHKDFFPANNSRLYLNTLQSVENLGVSPPFWGGGHTATAFSTGGWSDIDATGVQYVAYLFAHDPSADGVIQCGSYTGNGSATGPIVNLGWEPQYLMIRNTSNTGNWQIIDNMRGMPVGSANATLQANLSNAESSEYYVSPTATGFQGTSTSSEVNATSSTYIYLAIRRPNKPPTTGTEVYNAIARTGTGAANYSVTGVGFAPDWAMHRDRGGLGVPLTNDRLRGAAYLQNTNASAEIASIEYGFPTFLMDGVQTGYYTGGDGGNGAGVNYINHFLKRAPGFFDVVCYVGNQNNGRFVQHGLGVSPELVIIKKRNDTGKWSVTLSSPKTSLWLNHADAGGANINSPTSHYGYTDAVSATAISVAGYLGQADVNAMGDSYVALLFASKPGISKIGTYTGNNLSQTIDCGFSAGARFVLIKRTDSTGDWYVWDTARGIVAGNDPHLSLNTTAAEVTTNDSVDPDASGFIVNQVAATNVNVSGATYLYLAIA